MSAEPAPHTGTGSAPARLMALLRRPEVRGMSVVIAVKVMMVTLNFTLIFLAARTLDAVGFGYYSILFSAAGLLLIVATAGQELFVIRYWNEFAIARDTARMRGLIGFTCAMLLGGGLLASALLYVWAAATFGHPLALAVTAFMFVSAMLNVTDHLVRTAVSVAAGDGIGNLLQMLPAIVYLAASLLGGSEVSLIHLFGFLAGGALLGLTVHVSLMTWLVRKLFPDFRSTAPTRDTKVWLGRSARLWGSSTLEAVNQYVDVLIIGYLMSPTIAGAYFVTVRLANLFAAAADAINLFATRHFPGLYFRKQRRELDAFLDNVAWITVAFVGVGMVGIAAGGYFALLVINPDYTVYYGEMLILCVGTATLAIARTSGSILMLTGHEGRYLRIIALSVVVRVAGLFLLIPPLGILGAVTATALSFIVSAVAMRNAALKMTGFDASVLRLIGRNRQMAPAAAE